MAKPASPHPDDATQGPWIEGGYCPVKLYLINKLTGQIWQADKPCDRWRCPKCGPKKAVRAIRHGRESFQQYPEIWRGVFVDNWESTRNLMRQRRRRAGNAAAVQVVRDGQVHVYSERDLSTSRDVFQGVHGVLSPDVAANLLEKESLLVPGVDKVLWNSGWKPPKEHETGTGVFINPFGGLGSPEVTEEIDRELDREFPNLNIAEGVHRAEDVISRVRELYRRIVDRR